MEEDGQTRCRAPNDVMPHLCMLQPSPSYFDNCAISRVEHAEAVTPSCSYAAVGVADESTA